MTWQLWCIYNRRCAAVHEKVFIYFFIKMSVRISVKYSSCVKICWAYSGSLTYIGVLRNRGAIRYTGALTCCSARSQKQAASNDLTYLTECVQLYTLSDCERIIILVPASHILLSNITLTIFCKIIFLQVSQYFYFTVNFLYLLSPY